MTDRELQCEWQALLEDLTTRKHVKFVRSTPQEAGPMRNVGETAQAAQPVITAGLGLGGVENGVPSRAAGGHGAATLNEIVRPVSRSAPPSSSSASPFCRGRVALPGAGQDRAARAGGGWGPEHGAWWSQSAVCRPAASGAQTRDDSRRARRQSTDTGGEARDAFSASSVPASTGGMGAKRPPVSVSIRRSRIRFVKKKQPATTLLERVVPWEESEPRCGTVGVVRFVIGAQEGRMRK